MINNIKIPNPVLFQIIKFLNHEEDILNFSICNKIINNKFKQLFNPVWNNIKEEYSNQKDQPKRSTTWEFFLIDEVEKLNLLSCSSLSKVLTLSRKSSLQGISSKEPWLIFNINDFLNRVKKLETIQDKTLISVWPSLREAFSKHLNTKQDTAETLAPIDEQNPSKVRESISCFSKNEKPLHSIDLMNKNLSVVPFDLYKIKIFSIILSNNKIKYIDCSYFLENKFLSIGATENDIKFVNIGNNKNYDTLSFASNSLNKFNCGNGNKIKVLYIINNNVNEFDCKDNKIDYLYINENPIEKFNPNKNYETKSVIIDNFDQINK